MDRVMLVSHLEVAERHVREAEARVVRQRSILLNTESSAHEAVEDRELLRLFEKTLAAMISDRVRIRRDLERLKD